MGELREYLEIIKACVIPDNIIAWGVRNYFQDDVNVKQSGGTGVRHSEYHP